jgi:hypothetical protein
VSHFAFPSRTHYDAYTLVESSDDQLSLRRGTEGLRG